MAKAKKKKPNNPIGPIVPGGRNPSRVYERDVIDRTVPRRIPTPAPRNYETNYNQPRIQQPARLYETGVDGAQSRYSQPNRLYESDIINNATNAQAGVDAARARAGQGRAGGGYGPVQAGGYGPQPGTPGYNPGGPNGPGDPGSGGNGGGFGDVAEAPVDPVLAEQEAFIKRLLALKDETIAGYGPAANNIRGYYDTASSDLADPYNTYTNAYRTGAQSLGLNFDGDDNVKLADLAARKLQENYDLNETTDLSTIEKMKSLNTDSFTQMQLAAEAGLLGPQAIANQLALEAAGQGGGGGGGGGGGRGGGGSGGGSDNPWSEKATQDEAYFNAGLADEIAGMADPRLRSYLDQTYAGTGTNPQNMLNKITSDMQAASNFRAPVIKQRPGGSVFNRSQYLQASVRKNVAQIQNAAKLKMIQNAYNWAKGQSAGYKPQVTNNKVSTTSTTKYG